MRKRAEQVLGRMPAGAVASVLSLLCALGCSDDSGAANSAALTCSALTADCAASVPTYAGSVQGIIDLRCGPCHRPDNPGGPWPLDNYQDVADWSLIIENQVDGCLLASPHFHNPLSAEERGSLSTWLSCGAPER